MKQLMPGLWQFRDTCNVYVVQRGAYGLAFDFGSGVWLKALPKLGIHALTDVFLTHHHADQCAGLERLGRRDFTVHAPAGEREFLAPEEIRRYRRMTEKAGCVVFPRTYHLLQTGLRKVMYDVNDNQEFFRHGLCVRVCATPGHGPAAVSYVVEINGQQVGFCGDAAYAGGTVWEPYNLEWDHWTGKGALAAWQGVSRLACLGLDWLCPSHGPVIAGVQARTALRQLQRRLIKFYEAKGAICAGEKDHWIIPEDLPGGLRKILPHLLMGPGNSYFLQAQTGEFLVVDPTLNDLQAFEKYLRTSHFSGRVRIAAALVTHAHYDHYQDLPHLQRCYGTQLWLHPRLVEAVRRAPDGLYRARFVPRIDHVWPERGEWRWCEYVFRVAPWPGQTWWHCVFMAEIDGVKVLFGGDSFQPTSRWNGTGGFCALNRSRFEDGFVSSAQLVLRWRPEMVVTGHHCAFRFTPSRFQRIIRWARAAEKAVAALCPSGSLTRDYYLKNRRFSGAQKKI